MVKSMNDHLKPKLSPAIKEKVSDSELESGFETLLRNEAEQVVDARKQRLWLFRPLALNNDQRGFRSDLEQVLTERAPPEEQRRRGASPAEDQRRPGV